MPLIQLTNVSMSFGGQAVLEDITWGLHAGQRVGLIGANGTGKTTLLRILAGAIEPEGGRADRGRRLRIGFMEQEPDLAPDDTMHDAALAAFADLFEMERRMRELEQEIADADEAGRAALLARLGRRQEQFERANGYDCENRASAALMGLGFRRDDFDRPVSVLSGGEKSRIALARLLLREPDLLLLDEPTNHLDLDGIEWLENFLAKRFRGAVVLVSHDRLFLDRTVAKIVELRGARLAEYRGNYSKYVQLKERQTLEQRRKYEQQQEFIRKEEDFIRRQHAGQRYKEARGRQKRLDRVERHKKISVRFQAERNSGEVCVRAEGLSKRFGERTLFEDLTFEVYRGARVGIIGPNGSGKTTLLRMVMGRLAPDGGALDIGHHLAFGYLEQESADLNSERSVLDEVWERKRRMDEVEARSVLGRFLISGDEAVNKRLCDLSGGERRRVALACFMVEQPNCLVLDEPTNHLDIASRVALEEALLEYPGTILAVSHDRYFLNRIARKLIVLGDSGARVVHGTYEDYERQRASRPVETPHPKPTPPARTRAKPALSKNRLAQLEREIAGLEEEKGRIEAELARPDLYADADKARDLPSRYREVAERLDALYAEWARQEG